MKYIYLITTLLFSGLSNAEMNIRHDIEDFVLCETKKNAIDMVYFLKNDHEKFKKVLQAKNGSCILMNSFKSNHEVFVVEYYEPNNGFKDYCKLAIYEYDNGRTTRSEFYSFENYISNPCEYYEYHAFDRYYDPTQEKDR